MMLFLTIFLLLTTAVPSTVMNTMASDSKPAEEISETSEKESVPVKVNLTELATYPKMFEGRNIETGGILIQTSSTYFPYPVFALTNRTDTVRITAWLPLEVAPPPKGLKKKRISVMSDFLNKYVIISGKVILNDGKPLIEVKNARTTE